MTRVERKHFSDFDIYELYKILQLRHSVFIAEQENYKFEELDDKDQTGYHICIKDDEDDIKAYIRIIQPGLGHEEHPELSRIMSLERGKGYGRKIVGEGVKLCGELGYDNVYIQAQIPAIEFYEKIGFEKISDEYIHHGIPHVEMVYKIK